MPEHIFGLSADLWVAIFTAVLAVATVALGFATVLLWKATRDAIDDARISSAIELRPYVFVKQTTINFFYNEADKSSFVEHEFIVVWENTGSTPTRNVRSGINRRWFPESMPPDFDFPDYAPAEVQQQTLIGPQQLLSVPIRMPTENLAKAAAGQGKVYIWAWIEYDDGFVGSERHRTEVCSEVVITGDPTKPGAKYDLRHRGRFNAADADCFRKPASTRDGP